MTSLQSPQVKRIKLEDISPKSKNLQKEGLVQLIAEPVELESDHEEEENSCSICLHSIADRTVIPKCSHEFCFECLLVWTEQSRRCPLCSQSIGEYIIHSIRSRYDYRKHHLPPLRTTPPPPRPVRTNVASQSARQVSRRRRREREWGTGEHDSEEADKLERSIAKRRWIYQYDLYAKHVASNGFTKYRPYPTPAQFSASQDLISRTTTFLRRELQVWEGLDVEFLTTLIISLMKAIDIRSESAVKLISEFLDMDAPYTPGGRHVNAEHFAHEVYSYVRSPYRDLFIYDTVVQYDILPSIPPPLEVQRTHRWRQLSPSRPSSSQQVLGETSQLRATSRSRSSGRDTSWSPSGRKYPRTPQAGEPNYSTNIGSESPHVDHDNPNTWIRTPQHNETELPDIEAMNTQCFSGKVEQTSRSRTPVLSLSLKPEKLLPIIGVERDVKGKRKADGIEMAYSYADEAVSDGNVTGPRLGKMVVNPQLAVRKNDDDIRSSKFRRPRNRTLFDSVKAHLDGTTGQTRPSASGNSAQRRQVPRTSYFPESSTSSPPNTSDSVPSLLTRLSDSYHVPITSSIHSTTEEVQALNVSDGCQQEAVDCDKPAIPQNMSPTSQQDPIRSQKPSRLSLDANCAGQYKPRLLEQRGHSPQRINVCLPSRLQATAQPNSGLSAEINGCTSNAGKQQQPINAVNSNVAAIATHNTNVINQPRLSSSSSTHAQDCALEAAVASKKISQDGINSSVEIHYHDYPNHGLSSCSPTPETARSIQFPSQQTQFRDSVVPHVELPSRPSIAQFPIERVGHPKSASINDQSHLLGHATPLNLVQMRTRLLARLEIEKRQAQTGQCSETSGNHAQVSSLNAHSSPRSMNVDRDGAHSLSLFDNPTVSPSGATSDSLRRTHSDPNAALEFVAEDAKKREAALRARARLHARLASEKRLVDAGE